MVNNQMIYILVHKKTSQFGQQCELCVLSGEGQEIV